MNILSQILLLLYALVVIRPVLPVCDYFLRFEVYSQELCEKRDDPTSSCKGSCQMKKNVMATVEEGETSGNDQDREVRRTASEESLHCIFFEICSSVFSEREHAPTVVLGVSSILSGFENHPYTPPRF